MPRPLLFCILSALAVSLWFNSRNLDGPIPKEPAKPMAAPVTVLPGSVGEMDFSGTRLPDESWQLEAEVLPETIPMAIPVEGSAAIPPALSPEAKDWDVDTAIQMAPGAAKKDR